MTLTPDLYSYSYIICRGLLERIKAVPTFSTIKRFGTSRAPVIQPEHLPYLGCYFMEETLSPDGDANAGEPRFINSMKLGFSVRLLNNDTELAEDSLDAAHWTLMNLLTNPMWHTFPMPSPFPAVEIESVTRGSRRHAFGNSGQNNETPFAELQMDLTIMFRTGFPPVITDTLDTVHVTVAYPWPFDPGANDPFTIQYDLTAS